MSDYKAKLTTLVESGELAVISAGFRCFTKREISKNLGIKQESLAFDSGFFPPSSVAQMLKSEKIDLEPGHTACIKTENFQHAVHGVGILFEPTSYDHIDGTVTSRDMPDMNRYLDSTFGYYTLDRKNEYVLAHYNWHHFGAGADGRIHDIGKNIKTIGETLSKRLLRIKKKCREAKSVLLVAGETQGYRHMTIGDKVFILNEITPILEAARKLYGDKFQLVTLKDIPSAKAALIAAGM